MLMEKALLFLFCISAYKNFDFCPVCEILHIISSTERSGNEGLPLGFLRLGCIVIPTKHEIKLVPLSSLGLRKASSLYMSKFYYQQLAQIYFPKFYSQIQAFKEIS